jgi:hypothetical protein
MSESTQYALYALERTLKYAVDVLELNSPDDPIAFAILIIQAMRQGHSIPEFVTNMLHTKLNDVGADDEPEYWA